ncbi:MAG TPA: extracellular solute-binding protein [Bacillales bacterium]|nr:extracellular solute-binding protein [Bacillales bacterium]
MKKLWSSLVVSVLSVALLAGCGSSGSGSAGGSGSSGGSGGKKVQLELFSNKSESIETYKELIKEFESKNPNITVKLEAPPEAETVLKTRLTKNNLPDIISMGATSTYRELARAGVLMDFSNYDKLNTIQPAYVKMIGKVVGSDKKGVYGIPYATNANGVIYNKTKFEKLGFKVPQTWDEFMNELKKAKQAGEIPIYFTLKDPWTAMVTWNSLAANLAPDNFAEMKSNGKASFQEDYKDVASKFLDLLKYGHKDNFGVGYGDGNKAFANGKGVFYLQGNWAIPEIKKANPDVKLGMFAFPASNDASKNRLVSGVDVLLTITKSTKHKEEAQKFIDFMLTKETAQKYTDEQAAFSAVKGVFQKDQSFTDIKKNFEQGTIVGFPDHFYPAGFQAANLVQEFLIKKNEQKFLKKMDTTWDKVLQR